MIEAKMLITAVEVVLINENTPLKAVFSVKLDNHIEIHQIKMILLEREEKRFLRFPYDNKKNEVVSLLNQETRTYFEETLFKVYDRLKGEFKNYIPQHQVVIHQDNLKITLVPIF